MPGELTAFVKRMAGMSPSPFAPTSPLRQGQYTIVIFYEHNWKEDREHPLRLRYGFATLDSEGKADHIPLFWKEVLCISGIGRMNIELSSETHVCAAACEADQLTNFLNVSRFMIR